MREEINKNGMRKGGPDDVLIPTYSVSRVFVYVHPSLLLSPIPILRKKKRMKLKKTMMRLTMSRMTRRVQRMRTTTIMMMTNKTKTMTTTTMMTTTLI